MYWNVGNLFLCTGMLAICCYVLKCSGTVCCYQKQLLLCTEMQRYCLLLSETVVVLHCNVGNLLLCTVMLIICCYVLECWQFFVMYWNVSNLLLCTEMQRYCLLLSETVVVMYCNVAVLFVVIRNSCCYVLECSGTVCCYQKQLLLCTGMQRYC